MGLVTITLWLWTVCSVAAMAGAVFYGPSPYLSFTNSPFAGMTGFDYFYLETFEDGLLNTPGVTVNSGWLVNVPSFFADSVDADDGSIDGSGIAGHSLLSGGVQSNLLVTFDSAALGGHLPTHAGVVATDIGNVLFGQFGFGDFTFSARDGDGRLLGSISATNFGNGSSLGNFPDATAEDRFFGVSNPAGISSISLSVNNSLDWEVDHLQYGYLFVSDFAPELRIWQSAPDTVELAWSTNAAGFTLEEAFSLPATNWTSVPTEPTIVDGDNQVTVTPLSANHFYRLRRQ